MSSSLGSTLPGWRPGPVVPSDLRVRFEENVRSDYSQLSSSFFPRSVSTFIHNWYFFIARDELVSPFNKSLELAPVFAENFPETLPSFLFCCQTCIHVQSPTFSSFSLNFCPTSSTKSHVYGRPPIVSLFVQSK